MAGNYADDAQIEEERRELDKALRSTNAREKLDGLKRLIGMMSSGKDVSSFFAAVVMNLAQDSFELKVLVYIYLVRTAEQKADEALLSINSFQKDLAHPNPRVRALALRVMSSIRVPMIVPVVILAVRKCAVDVSPYVRKAAAAAIPKVFRLDATRQNELVEIIETMLRDSTPFVLSSAVAAFQEVCPTRVDLIHRHFRKICRMLVDMDEWGQILMANLLTRYARAQFKQPDAYDRELTASSVARGSGQVESPTLALALPGDGGAFEKQSANPVGTAGFYSDSESSDGSSDASDSDDDDDSDGDTKKRKTKPSKPKAPKQNASLAAAANAGGESYLDDDHRLLLRSSRPLLQSQNAGVVMAVGALHFYLAPVADLPKTLRALVFAMRCKPESQHIVLKNICTMVAVQPTLFETHFNAFFVHPADPLDVRGLKLEILTHVCTAENAPVLLRELQAYLRSSNDQFVALTIRAIGRCAAIMPQIATVCVRSLLELSLHPSEKVAGEAVVVIRALVQRDPKEHLHVVMRLIRRMEQLRSPAARAAVAWLAGGELYVFGADAEKDAEAEAVLERVKAVAPVLGAAGDGASATNVDGRVDTETDGPESAAETPAAAPSPEHTGKVLSTVRAVEQGALHAIAVSANGEAKEEPTTDAEAADSLMGEPGAAASETATPTEVPELDPVQNQVTAMVISSKDSSKKKDKKKYRKEKAQAAKVERKARVVSAAKSARETRTDFWELAFAVIKRSLNGFPNETDTTKLQILNTACKLYVKSPERAGPVLSHLLAMCACDGSVDIRDRARVYKAMFAVGGNATPLATFGKQILLCAKPAPALPSPAAQTCLHALGSLSHAVEHKAPGFVDLPAHPQVAPPSSVRDLHYASANDAAGKSGKAGKGGGDFYSDSDDSDSDGSFDSSEYTDSENESGSGSSDDSGSGSGSDGDSGDSAGSGSDDSGSSSDDDADDVSDDDASSDSE